MVISKKKRRVLVVGSGGREVALYEAIKHNKQVEQVFVAPGNSAVPHQDRLLVQWGQGRYGDLILTSLARHIDLVVVGPDDPIVYGIWDSFNQHAPSISVVAPSRMAAELEGSKLYLKTRCRSWGIPTAPFDFAGAYPVAEAVIKRSGYRVIKADGLMFGKGVTVAKSEDEALAAAHTLLVTQNQRAIITETLLEGEELSYFALCDGAQFVRLPCSRDYKRVAAGSDLMTGGMGAYAPVLSVGEGTLCRIEHEIITPLLAGMARAGRPYHGVLYAGIMLTSNGPYLLEVNCRFGDPEAQVILPLIDDILPYLWATTQTNGLKRMKPPVFSHDRAVCVCLAGAEYPHQGHRVASVVGVGPTIAAARERAYQKVSAYPGVEKLQYRTDIAAGV